MSELTQQQVELAQGWLVAVERIEMANELLSFGRLYLEDADDEMERARIALLEALDVLNDVLGQAEELK